MFKVQIDLQSQILVLRAGPSELHIVAEHVEKLQQLTAKNEFATYFREQALLNRPARKLFASWLRKERGLWQRIYQIVHAAADKA